MGDRRYAYPDVTTRRRLAVGVILCCVGVLALGLILVGVVRPWLEHWFADLEELAKHDPAAAMRSLRTVFVLVAAVEASLAGGAGVWALYQGWQMTRADQWPRPGARIYWRVRILDGKSARRRGKALMVMGLIVLMLAAAIVWQTYRASSTFFGPAG